MNEDRRDIGQQGHVGGAVASDQQRSEDHEGFPAPLEVDGRRPSLAIEGEGATYYDQPVIKEPVWIWSVPAYFYTGGAAAGASLIGAVAQLVDRQGYAGLIDRCRWIAAAGTAMGTAFLIHDLGRPARFLNMLRVFRPTSAMSMGSWTLAAAASASGAAATLPRLGGERLADAAGLGAGVLAPVLGTYTGVLVSDTAVPVWNHARRELPAFFGASALASATDLLELFPLDDRSHRVVRRIGIAAKTADLAFATGVEQKVGEHQEVGVALTEGPAGDLWRTAKLGTALSLLVSLLPLPGRLRRRLSAALGVIGAIAGRFAVFRAGFASARAPRATFAPQRRRRGGVGQDSSGSRSQRTT